MFITWKIPSSVVAFKLCRDIQPSALIEVWLLFLCIGFMMEVFLEFSGKVFLSGAIQLNQCMQVFNLALEKMKE